MTANERGCPKRERVKIWILSDLHLEVAPLDGPLVVPDADVCVVAGDLCRGPENGVRWLEEKVADRMPCVYVAGNHEFYKGSIREGVEAGRAASAANGRFISWKTRPHLLKASRSWGPRSGRISGSRGTSSWRWHMPGSG